MTLFGKDSKRLALHWQILIALVLAALAGTLTNPQEHSWLLDTYSFLGKLFLNALKMIVIPLIVAAIIHAMSDLGKEKSFARLGGKTIAFYLMSTLVAVVTGLIFVNLFSPGTQNGVPLTQILEMDQSAVETIQSKTSGQGTGALTGIFLRMFPSNIVEAAAQGKMLGLITFSMLFGFFSSRLKGDVGQSMKNFWAGTYEVMLKITQLIMKFAPIGIFGLVAKTITTTGWDSFASLITFFGTVSLSLAFHAMVTLPLILKFFAKISPRKHFQAMSPALLTAFSTASSSATLPETIQCIQKDIGVSKRVSGFTIPLGATVNMDGTALYECVAAMFVAQAYGVELSISTQIVVVLIALLTSIGVAGIPSASLVAIVIILQSIGLPLEALGLILVVDRILDMMRTSVNVFSDSCAASIIARTEGETLKTQLDNSKNQV